MLTVLVGAALGTGWAVVRAMSARSGAYANALDTAADTLESKAAEKRQAAIERLEQCRRRSMAEAELALLNANRRQAGLDPVVTKEEYLLYVATNPQQREDIVRNGQVPPCWDALI